MQNEKRIRRAPNEAGFTLIEIMVVVIVLAIMAGLIVPKFTGVTEDATASRVKADLVRLENSIETYKITAGEYPSNDLGFDALVNPPEGVKVNMTLKKLPLDPWETPYEYELSEDGKTFDIWSYGSDKQEGGEGAAKDIHLDESNQDEG